MQVNETGRDVAVAGVDQRGVGRQRLARLDDSLDPIITDQQIAVLKYGREG